jgi:3-oxoacyl-[acyl-carrier protein] reductase
MKEVKTAIVCGSTQGIGKSIALQLASEGVRVVLVGRNQERLQEIHTNLEKAFGTQPQPIQADFSMYFL